MDLGGADLDMLAVQLTAALDGPLLLYLAASDPTAALHTAERIADSWQDLVQRVCRPLPHRRARKNPMTAP
jgi:polyketide synthase 12